MDSRMKWIAAKVRLGWTLLVAGVLAGVAGVVAERVYANSPYNYRIITGVGIALTGAGVGYLIRYRAAMKDEQSARRLTAEERDERTVLIRSRAGSRAFWVSTAMVYTGLMWASFAANGGLPALDGDKLWYFLAAATLVPFGVYVGSVIVDERTF